MISKKERETMKLKVFLALVFALSVFIGCSSDEKKDENTQQSEQSTATMAPDVHKVTIEEIIQANSYTYLRVNENGKEDWLAISKRTDFEDGQTIYYKDAMEMKEFHSEDLNRDFESVWFVQTVSDKPIGSNPMMGSGSPHSNVKPEADESISVEPVTGGITIAQLFDNKAEYKDKEVKIKGKVVKVNNGIMGRNWVHIQDGTGNERNYDLTVTTNDKVQVGEIVVVEGSVTLDKDFGSGYKYDVILENTKVSSQTIL